MFFYIRYKGLIAFSTIEETKTFVESFKKLNSQEHIPGVIRILCEHSGEQYKIDFINGSRIQIITQSPANIRGWHRERIHEVLYHNGITATINAMLSEIETPYIYREYLSKPFFNKEYTMSFISEEDRTEPQGSDELDNFLKSFSINK